MSEPNLYNVRQKVYDVLNVHTPTDCGSGHCWAVEKIEKIIAQQVKEAVKTARIDELEGVKKALFIEAAIGRRLARLKGDDK